MALSNTFTISAQNTWSDEVTLEGDFSFSLVSSSFVGTLTLQRKFNASDSWRDIATYTGSFEGQDVQSPRAIFRAGVKTGAYTSGSISGVFAYNA